MSRSVPFLSFRIAHCISRFRSLSFDFAKIVKIPDTAKRFAKFFRDYINYFSLYFAMFFEQTKALIRPFACGISSARMWHFVRSHVAMLKVESADAMGRSGAVQPHAWLSDGGGVKCGV